MSPSDICKTFAVELEALENITNTSDENQPIPEIVTMYHRVINVSSMITVLDDARPDKQVLSEQILHARHLISKFNSDIHPRVQEQLFLVVQELGDAIRNMEHTGRNDSSTYDELRQAMSTLDFVGQYDRTL